MESLEPSILRRNRTPLTAAEVFLRRYFARRIVQPWQLPSIMRRHIYTGAMGSLWGTLITGIFFTYFGVRIGLKPIHWGILGAVASFGLSSEILSARATHHFQRRKVIWFICAFTDRIMRFLGILLSLWLWHAGRPSAAVALIIVISAANCIGAMATTPWLSWLADIIPEEVQGRFWGRRTAWIAFVVAAATVPAAVLMDRTPENGKLELTVVVFLAATVFGLLDLIIHGTIPEPRMAQPPQNTFLEEILLPIRDVNFQPWLVFNFVWYLVASLGGALSILYCVENLKMKEHFVSGMVSIWAVSMVGSVLTAGWSGRLVDRVGPKKVLFWSYLGWATIPAFWVFATPETAFYWVCGASIMGGVAVTAAVNAATKLVTRFPKAEQRAMYIAVSDTTNFIGSGLGALAAGIIAKLLADWSCVLAGWTFNIFHAIFVVSVLLRFAVVPLFLRRVKNPPGLATTTA